MLGLGSVSTKTSKHNRPRICQLRKYMEFSDHDYYATASASTDFKFGNGTNDADFSFFCWIRPSSFDDESILFQSTAADSYSFYIKTDGKLVLNLAGSNRNNKILFRSANALTVNKWTLVGFVNNPSGSGGTATDGSETQIYINGVSETLTVSNSNYDEQVNTDQTVAVSKNTWGFVGRYNQAIVIGQAVGPRAARNMYNGGVALNLYRYIGATNTIAAWTFGNHSSDTVATIKNIKDTSRHSLDQSTSGNQAAIAGPADVRKDR